MERFEGILRDVARRQGVAAGDAFGSWSDWGSMRGNLRDVHADGGKVTEPPAPRGNCQVTGASAFVDEVVDLGALRKYAACKIDRSQDQFERYSCLHECSGGVQSDNLGHLNQKYERKDAANRSIGRRYGQFHSLQFLTREAWGVARRSFARDIDIANAHSSCASLLVPDMPLLWVSQYKEHTDAWRRAVPKYYGVALQEAKIILIKALFGFITPPGGHSATLDPLPVVKRPAEDYAQVKNHLVAQNISHPKIGANRLTLHSHMSAEKEAEELTHPVSTLQLAGFALVAPIFDGAIVKPVSENADFAKAQNLLVAKRNVSARDQPPPHVDYGSPRDTKMKRRRLASPRAQRMAPPKKFPRLRTLAESLREGDLKGGELVGMQITCLPFCLHRLFPGNKSAAESAKAKRRRPFTFREMAANTDLMFGKLETFLGAAGATSAYEVGGRSPGHAVALSVDHTGSCVIYDSDEPRTRVRLFGELPRPEKASFLGSARAISIGNPIPANFRRGEFLLRRGPREIGPSCSFRRAQR